jgi:hypothetical protein
VFVRLFNGKKDVKIRLDAKKIQGSFAEIILSPQ